jgi:hypothetical protein
LNSSIIENAPKGRRASALVRMQGFSGVAPGRLLGGSLHSDTATRAYEIGSICYPFSHL